MGFFGAVKKIGGNIEKAVVKGAKDTGKATKKAVVDTGHAAGAVATSKLGQVALGTALAVSGVGLPAAAAIGAATKGGGALIKKGGNLGKAGTAAYQGAAVGAGAAVVGSGFRAIKSGTGLGGFKSSLLHGKDAIPQKATAKISGPQTAIVEPEYAVEPIVDGVTDSGEIKHDETDRLKESAPVLSLPEGNLKGTPTDLLTPFRRKLLGSGEPSRKPGDDMIGSVVPSVRIRGNPATVLPETEQVSEPAPIEPGSELASPKQETVKDNLPMLLAVAGAGVVIFVILGRQGRK